MLRGFRFAGATAGLKASGKKDLALVAADDRAVWAGIFTTNRVVAAPVVLSRRRLGSPVLRGLVVNSGNANACTGAQGDADADELVALYAGALGASVDEIASASTGIIGVPLDMPKLRDAIPRATAELSPGGFDAFAEAILTTDKGPKVASVEVDLGDARVTVAGCAKGAGMIHPRMATTLGFVFTDAAVDPSWLRHALVGEADETFNAISVDGDTSTNDSLFLLASGAAGGARVGHDDGRAAKLRAALRDVMRELSTAIVRDGEGATKLVTIRVVGARDTLSARAVAARIATSPLVKTALHGADPNWGRIVAAVGNAGVEIDPRAIDVDIGAVPVVRDGVGVAGPERAHKVMREDEYTIRVDLKRGVAEGHIVTCDLTREYIAINADYST